ncbi:hypothetical protein Agabi119p4_10097 [Agaricus bisporus var. burnettii]|uniref:Uncharacterized protein n=1 Tax=Agaricus bisporus var. burnettii TaxID=192524 RepID=A0A8H7EVZ9_AGABI|nr:hypothetical protein Agabi119p4_10097 [Agaricus bisporus var. burnettii]
MGCAQSNALQEDFFEYSPPPNPPSSKNNKLRPNSKKEIQVLLLGASQSGKSTFLKQLKLVYEGNLKQQELHAYREIILANTIQSLRDVLEAMSRLELQVSDANITHREAVLKSATRLDFYPLSRQLANAIRTVLNDSNVKEAISRSRWCQVNDSAVYYFEAIDRISSADYRPTDSDILHSYAKTTGISRTTFKVADCLYHVFDVGGTRSERRKWIHCFEKTSAVVFLVALSEYNQKLNEDESVNRMQESLTLFNSICNSSWFVDSTLVLLLNKVDLFIEKLHHSAMCEYFPDYTGGADYEAACVYLLRRFASLLKSSTKKIYAHYICATDPQQAKLTIREIQNDLLQHHMEGCNSL